MYNIWHAYFNLICIFPFCVVHVWDMISLWCSTADLWWDTGIAKPSCNFDHVCNPVSERTALSCIVERIVWFYRLCPAILISWISWCLCCWHLTLLTYCQILHDFLLQNNQAMETNLQAFCVPQRIWLCLADCFPFLVLEAKKALNFDLIVNRWWLTVTCIYFHLSGLLQRDYSVLLLCSVTIGNIFFKIINCAYQR